MHAAPEADAPPLPRSVRVLAWSSLAGQLVLLADAGVRADRGASIAVSVVLGALLVGYVASGVVRARTVRLVLAWTVLLLETVGACFRVFSAEADDAALAVLGLVSVLVSLAALARFRRSAWYAWQRTRPPVSAGPPVARLVLVGVLVGALGGLTASADGGVGTYLEVTV